MLATTYSDGGWEGGVAGNRGGGRLRPLTRGEEVFTLLELAANWEKIHGLPVIIEFDVIKQNLPKKNISEIRNSVIRKVSYKLNIQNSM
jgi:predicted solute-binding protein